MTSIDETAFSGTAWYNNQPDGLMYAGKVAYKYIGTMPENTSITLQEGTLGIAGNAFSGCSGLTSLTIPNSVTSIGGSAFSGCSGLTSVNIPNSVTSIGDGTFSGCSGLTSITIPNNVTSIGYRAFYDCSGLTSITIPNSVTSLGSSSFHNCSSLTSLTIPNSVTLIGDQAFNGCSSLTNIYNFRATPQSIWVSTFSNYSATLHVVKGYKATYGVDNYWNNFTIIEDLDIKISGSCGNNANYSLDTKTGLLSITGTGEMTNYSTGSSAPWYPQREFIKEVEISDGITSIGNYAFYGCINLPSMTIPNSVTAIGDNSFYCCSGLTSVSISSSIKSIGSSALGKCSELLNVYCNSRKGPTMGSDVFIESDIQFATLYVPETSINGYKSTSPWSGFGNIVALQDSDFKPNPEDELGKEKCATPTISYVNGKLEFSCETEDVEFVAKVTSPDMGDYEGSSIPLTTTYLVSVYAKREGYQNSDVATKEIEVGSGIAGKKGDVNEDGEVNGTDIQEVINIIIRTE